MGNSRWRLETTLNFIGKRVHELGREQDVEVLVADWGSEVPLNGVVELSPEAARIVSFILIPQPLAHDLQRDSPFPEVLALNAAARRARGDYIGRIDQDTLVGRVFFEKFFELLEGKRQLEVPLKSALLFSNLRMVPYRFSVRCPSFSAVDRFINLFGSHLKVEITKGRPFYCHGVGIWLASRELWNECGGYDEQMIYMNAMEIDMIARLLFRYRMVNLGKLVDYAFYHLEHYHPWVPRMSVTNRRGQKAKEVPDEFHPNREDWGLAGYSLEMSTSPCAYSKDMATRQSGSASELLGFIFLMGGVGAQITFDVVFLSLRDSWRFLLKLSSTWKHKAGVAKETTNGYPVVLWPRLLLERWRQRRAPRMGQKD